MSDLLTKREQDVVRILVEGKCNKLIARELGIAEGTVKIHLSHIFQKLGINSRLTLVVMTQSRK